MVSIIFCTVPTSPITIVHFSGLSPMALIILPSVGLESLGVMT